MRFNIDWSPSLCTHPNFFICLSFWHHAVIEVKNLTCDDVVGDWLTEVDEKSLHILNVFVCAGSNLVCTALHLSLTRLFDNVCKGGDPGTIDFLQLQVDNYVGENKSNVITTHFSTLVARGVIGTMETNFMPVGLTHNNIDQIFSR